MKARVRPRDATVPVKDFLATQVQALDPAITTGLSLPKDWTPSDPPAVVVFDDSGPVQWPVSTSPQIRVTVWAEGRTLAREIAGKCLGWLLCSKVPGIAHIGPGAGLLDGRDNSNHGFTASFTVTTRVRTVSF
ncbi:hypothetical protein [Rhodococcus spongiicola]|uniref:DUF3168 domain-containing protein n=1 Tax=Rhodococcus spongiicola TaxID=2487352 RepID=A0A3S3CUY4_9NOCA|nr:hypothetical protein [Rhodococcus spongiicola]RVW06227.1 hypothetical protein EF834_01870 [Rhodococcus spongiicola]